MSHFIIQAVMLQFSQWTALFIPKTVYDSQKNYLFGYVGLKGTGDSL
jgi:flagellar basal body P-ring protein FlgI